MLVMHSNRLSLTYLWSRARDRAGVLVLQAMLRSRRYEDLVETARRAYANCWSISSC